MINWICYINNQINRNYYHVNTKAKTHQGEKRSSQSFSSNEVQRTDYLPKMWNQNAATQSLCKMRLL